MATFSSDGITIFPDTGVRARVSARIPARPAPANACVAARSWVASPWSLTGVAVLIFTGPAIFVVQNFHSSASSTVTFLSLHSPLAIAAALLCPGVVGCAAIGLLTTVHVVRARRFAARPHAESVLLTAGSAAASQDFPAGPIGAQPPEPAQQLPEAVGTAVRTYTVVRMPSPPDPSRMAVWHWYRGTRPHCGRTGADAGQRSARGPASARVPGR